MHKEHLTGCLLAIGLALVLFTATGGSIGGLGLLLAVLICPITMGAVMWFLMGSRREGGTPHADEAPPDQQAPDASTAARR